MKKAKQSRVIGLLGVGFDCKDEHVRITQAENYNVIMGSGESHQALREICDHIDKYIKNSGRVLSDYTPEDFMELMQEIY